MSGKIEERRDYFAFGKIAGGAEENHGAGIAGTAIGRICGTRIGSHAFSSNGPATSGPVTTRKLYLNLQTSQVGSQLVWRLIVNNRKAEAAGALEIERAIVNENTLFGLSLGDG